MSCRQCLTRVRLCDQRQSALTAGNQSAPPPALRLITRSLTAEQGGRAGGDQITATTGIRLTMKYDAQRRRATVASTRDRLMPRTSHIPLTTSASPKHTLSSYSETMTALTRVQRPMLALLLFNSWHFDPNIKGFPELIRGTRVRQVWWSQL